MPKAADNLPLPRSRDEFSEAELRLMTKAIEICPEYRWMMRVFGDLRDLPPKIERGSLRWRLWRLPREDRRHAREWLAENMPSRRQRLTRRLRRRLAAELYALAVAVAG